MKPLKEHISLDSLLKIVFLNLGLMLVFSSCSDESKDNKSSDSKLFSLVNSKKSGISFKNVLEEKIERMWYNFNPVYDGGGVAIGDINNDGLSDIYFVGNEVTNRLYLNKGKLKFEDITEKYGLGSDTGWHNGPTMVDINNDGWLDIYVCRGGWVKEAKDRKNLLYINQKDGSFKESAQAYGIDDAGYSFQSMFFDYDLDGDLDMYLINHPSVSNIDIEEYKKGKASGNIYSKDRLYRNNGNNTFSDVTESAGLNQTFGFGLSVCSSDLDDNGYPDIYVSNDYTERDYLFMNNGDGTFSEKLKEVTGHVSLFAMGSDISDFNNDGHEDIFVTEMMPEDYKRSKTMMADMNPERFEYLVDQGFHYQYMHNTLQLNRGNGHFSEVSQLAGLSKTDWSWACYLVDFDNDGLRDAFVSNGYKRDVYDKDSAKDRQDYLAKNKNYIPDMDEFLSLTPVTKSVNYIFKNENGYEFTDRSKEWGMDIPSFSNGAAFGDLDNDGDLDIVVNNFDEAAFLYENNSDKKGANYLRIKLQGPSKNPLGIGARIHLKYAGKQQYEQFKTTRGYLSSVEPIAHFGLGNNSKVDVLEVEWNDGTKTIMSNVKSNQTIEVNHDQSVRFEAENDVFNPLISENTQELFTESFTHQENVFDDYQYQVLLPHRLSQLGPFVSKGDINGDGLVDFYVGGAKGQAGVLYVQNQLGTYTKKTNLAFNQDKDFEDMSSVMFDIDGDKDLDLYVVSGGTEELNRSEYYTDRLYINDGRGNFVKSKNQIPNLLFSGSCVVAEDFDLDGDLDLFVGGRTIPNVYPAPPQSVLLRNDNGKFTEVNNQYASFLNTLGMVTDAEWHDIDKNGFPDLIVVGEWMPVTILLNDGKRFVNATLNYGLTETVGWWNCISSADLDDDGDVDFVLGNLGKNYKFKASSKKPFHVFANDFDGNGSFDIFLAKNYSGDLVPVRGRQCSSEQVPGISQRFGSYNDFAEANINQILGPAIDKSLHYEAQMFSSIILRNVSGKFDIETLPLYNQLSAVTSIIIDDFNGDGQKDILTAGNMYNSEAETTRGDASVGVLNLGDSNGSYKPLSPLESGVFLPYDVKSMESLKLKSDKRVVLVMSNDDLLRSYEY